jgi:flagellar hook-associated protein 3 FlgL
MMRISDAAGYRSLIDNLSTLNVQYEQANSEVSSGKRLTHLHVAPADSAEMVQLNSQLAQIDQFQTNSDQSNYFLQVSESTLNSVYDLVTSIYTRGSEAASSLSDSGTRATLTAEIRSQRDQILTLANTEVRGRYLFAGSKSANPAFTISGDTAHYQGDDHANAVDISNGLTVRTNIPGSTAFSPVFSTVESLLTAIDAGDTTAIRSALSNFAGTLATVGRVRTTLGVDLGKIQDAAVARQTQETSIKSRQSHISDVDMAEAISRLTQAQTALQASLSAGSLVQQRNLFDYIG